MSAEMEKRAERLLVRAFESDDRTAPALEVVQFVRSTPDASERLRAFDLCAHALCADDPERAYRLFRGALDLLPPEDSVLHSRVLFELAVSASRCGQLVDAEEHYERGLAIAREHGFHKQEAGFVANLGILHVARGDPARGLECLLEARRLYARLGYPRGEGAVLVNAGPVYRILGAYPDALGALIEGIELCDREGLDSQVVTGLANLAVVYAAAGVPDEAVRCAEEARERAPADSADVVAAWTALAYAHGEAEDHAVAVDAAERGVEHARRLGEDHFVADALLRLGDTRRAAGQLSEAEAAYREGLPLAERMDEMQLRFGFQLGLARLLEQRGEIDGAHALAEPLLESWERFGEQHTLIELHDLLGCLAEARGDADTALVHVKRAQEIRTDLFRRETDVRVRSIQVAQQLRREREQSAEVLRGLSRRVMESQEEERRRVASDLHDDLGQRLALLAVEADLLAQSPASSPEELSVSLGSLAEQAQSAADQVHVICHHLHPAPLAQLGLVAATRAVCEEVGRIHDIRIEFAAEDVPRRVPDDIALCLYRIVQEGLNNATRHGHAPRAAVRLEATADGIRLELTDEGTGFDPDRLESPGIGLAGMRERACHLGGRFDLRSRPGQGTRIEILLPLPA